MKKIFTFMMALVAAVAVNATVVTLNPSDFSAATNAATSASKDGVSAALTSGTITADQIRIFKNQTITISSEKEISGIVFTCTANGDAQYGPGCFAAQAGYSFDGKIGTWVGTAAEVAFKAASNQVRATKIEVYLDGETPSAPTPQEAIKVTVAEAIAAGMALDSAKTSAELYEVTGYVVNSQAYSEQHKNQIWWMSDDAENTGAQEFEAYACTVSEDNVVMQVLDGDQVALTGNITKYYDKNNKKFIIEIKNGTAVFVSKIDADHSIPEPAPADTVAVTVAQAVEIGKALADKAVTDKVYEITGYVSSIAYAFSEKYGDETFWIMDEKGSTAASTAEGAFYVYRGKPNTGAEVGLNGKIKIVCKIKNYGGVIENDGSNITFEVLEQGEGVNPPVVEQLDTITVARALEIGAELADNGVSDKKYVIGGYVSSIEAYFDTIYKNETFWIADEKGSTAASNANGAFYVFRGKPTPAEEMGLEAKVYVTCKIKKYVKEGKDPVIENEKANDAVEVVEKGHEEVIESITVAQALEIGLALADKAVSDKRYEITGYASFIVEAYNSTYGNETFWITDEPGSSASSSAAGAFEVYRGKPNPAQEVGFDGKVKIVCKIKNFKGTIENDGMNLPFELLEPGTFSIDTINVATAIETTQAMEQGLISREFYAVKGYVANVSSPYDAKYSNMSFYMTDDFSATEGDFQCYRAKVAAEDSLSIVQGVYVIVTGHLDNNSHGIQMASGASVVIAEAPKMDTINIARALEIGAALEDNTATKDPYIVVGYVASIDVPYEEEIQSFSLSDSNEAVSGDFKAVNAFIDEPGAELHNRIAITGYIQKVVSGNLTQIRMEKGKAQIIPEEGIKHINASDSVAKKVVIDGVIYIVRDNKVFNLQGAQVR